jgi:hypothetical protein
VTVTYTSAHQRVHRKRGKASEYPCVDTGLPAEEWSYKGDCPDERIEQGGRDDGRRYCPRHPECYEPRTVAAHRAYDAALRRAREAVEALPEPLTVEALADDLVSAP